MGMVGGGRGAFIGAVHRMAARLDDRIQLVCGALSGDPERARVSGADLHLPAERCYGSWEEMIEREAALPLGERMDFVAIVTPNHLHHPIARRALEAGFDVACDKPLARTADEVRELAGLVERTGACFLLTHNYAGYPLVLEARARITAGELGAVRKVVVEYPQGWLASALEATGQKQAAWRTDPEQAGAAGCLGDIGTHGHHLAEYLTGLRVTHVCADLTTFVEGRRVDDDASVLLRFGGGARGILAASQVSIDEENGLAIRVYGERGGVSWRQEEPNTLVVMRPERPRELLRTAGPGLSPAAARASRLPAGHPEGFIEAFANLYRDFADTIDCRLRGDDPPAELVGYPGVDAGLRGMLFLEAVLANCHGSEKWTEVPKA